MYDPTVCDIVVRTAKGFLQIYLVRMTEMEPWYPALLGLAEHLAARRRHQGRPPTDVRHRETIGPNRAEVAGNP